MSDPMHREGAAVSVPLTLCASCGNEEDWVVDTHLCVACYWYWELVDRKGRL